MSNSKSSASSDASSEVFRLAKQLGCTHLHPTDVTKPKSKLRDKVGDNVLYEYAEHKHIGDSITLQGHGNDSLVLRTNLRLTYGEINGLAGDFFGTKEPICLGSNDQDCEKRFLAAYNTLVAPSTDAYDLVKTLMAEVESFKKAKTCQELKGVSFSSVYKPAGWLGLQTETLRLFNSTPSYLALGSINLDHFGEDARKAYNTGHRVALKHAAKGSLKNNSNMSSEEIQRHLVEAYTMNAFADHFLQDQFASGHLRTPRRKLIEALDSSGSIWNFWEDKAKNFCAKAMHDEDNNSGLMVRSPDRSDSWKVFGDGHLLDTANADGLQQCIKAIQASVDEVYGSWKNGTVPTDKDFKAWNHAPIPESIASLNNPAPMFDHEGRVRKPLDGSGPFTYVYVEDWTKKAVETTPGREDKGAYAGVESKGYAFPTAVAKADGSIFKVEDSGGDQHQFLGGNAGATFGSYIGLDAGVHVYKLDSDRARLKIGFGADTGVGIKDGSIEGKFIGTGFSFGRTTGFSFFGSEIKVKLW